MEANSRLTADTAVVLFVLLAVEGVTIPRIGGLLSPRVVVGMILVPPVLAMIASTSWRFARYHPGDSAYRGKGPPAVVLRVLRPLLVVLTVALFASSTALLLDPIGFGGHLLLIRRDSFIIWLAVTVVHVLGHLVESGRLAPRDWMRRTRRQVLGAGVRQLIIVASLVVWVTLAASLVDRVNDYRQSFHGGHQKTLISPSGSEPLPSSDYPLTDARIRADKRP